MEIMECWFFKHNFRAYSIYIQDLQNKKRKKVAVLILNSLLKLTKLIHKALLTHKECLCITGALAVASSWPQTYEHTLCNLNPIFLLFCIPRTNLFGHNLLPRELLIWTVPYRSCTAFRMKKYFSIPHFSGPIYRISFNLIETLCFSFCWESSGNSYVRSPSWCSVPLLLWILHENHEIASNGSLIDLCYPYLSSLTLVPSNKTYDTENSSVKQTRKNCCDEQKRYVEHTLWSPYCTALNFETGNTQ